jgi:hypothetical protein
VNPRGVAEAPGVVREPASSRISRPCSAATDRRSGRTASCGSSGGTVIPVRVSAGMPDGAMFRNLARRGNPVKQGCQSVDGSVGRHPRPTPRSLCFFSGGLHGLSVASWRRPASGDDNVKDISRGGGRRGATGRSDPRPRRPGACVGPGKAGARDPRPWSVTAAAAGSGPGCLARRHPAWIHPGPPSVSRSVRTLPRTWRETNA